MDEDALGCIAILAIAFMIFTVVVVAIEDPTVLLWIAAGIAVMVGCYQLDNHD